MRGSSATSGIVVVAACSQASFGCGGGKREKEFLAVRANTFVYVFVFFYFIVYRISKLTNALLSRSLLYERSL